MNYNNLLIVFVFICADIVTGLIGALATNTFKSKTMREGINHKLGEVFSMILVYAAQYLLPEIGITIDIPIVQTLSIYLVIMEIGSIIENLCVLNPELKDALKNLFSFLKKGDNK